MSPSTARAVSMALLGGITAPLFLAGGLLEWAAFIGWAVLLAAGGDTPALKKTIPGFVVGAFLAWLAMMIRNQVDVSAAVWLWMPRAGIAAAVALLVLGLAAKVDALSYLPAGLVGFACVFGALTFPSSVALDLQSTGPSLGERLTALHMYNPFIQASLSLVGGAIVGLLSARLARALSKE